MKQKFRLYGKTQEDIESQLLAWKKKNPDLAFKRHPIQQLAPLANRSAHGKQHVAFSMLIEYELPSRRPRPRVGGA